MGNVECCDIGHGASSDWSGTHPAKTSAFLVADKVVLEDDVRSLTIQEADTKIPLRRAGTGPPFRVLVVVCNSSGARHKCQGSADGGQAIRSMLANNCGFQERKDNFLLLGDTGPLPRPTRENVLNAITWLTSYLGSGDSALFYFVGHSATALATIDLPVPPLSDGSTDCLICFDYPYPSGQPASVMPSDNTGIISDKELVTLLLPADTAGVRMSVIIDSPWRAHSLPMMAIAKCPACPTLDSPIVDTSEDPSSECLLVPVLPHPLFTSTAGESTSASLSDSSLSHLLMLTLTPSSVPTTHASLPPFNGIICAHDHSAGMMSQSQPSHNSNRQLSFDMSFGSNGNIVDLARRLNVFQDSNNSFDALMKSVSPPASCVNSFNLAFDASVEGVNTPVPQAQLIPSVLSSAKNVTMIAANDGVFGSPVPLSDCSGNGLAVAIATVANQYQTNNLSLSEMLTAISLKLIPLLTSHRVIPVLMAMRSYDLVTENLSVLFPRCRAVPNVAASPLPPDGVKRDRHGGALSSSAQLSDSQQAMEQSFSSITDGELVTMIKAPPLKRSRHLSGTWTSAAGRKPEPQQPLHAVYAATAAVLEDIHHDRVSNPTSQSGSRMVLLSSDYDKSDDMTLLIPAVASFTPGTPATLPQSGGTTNARGTGSRASRASPKPTRTATTRESRSSKKAAVASKSPSPTAPRPVSTSQPKSRRRQHDQETFKVALLYQRFGLLSRGDLLSSDSRAETCWRYRDHRNALKRSLATSHLMYIDATHPDLWGRMPREMKLAEFARKILCLSCQFFLKDSSKPPSYWSKLKYRELFSTLAASDSETSVAATSLPGHQLAIHIRACRLLMRDPALQDASPAPAEAALRCAQAEVVKWDVADELLLQCVEDLISAASCDPESVPLPIRQRQQPAPWTPTIALYADAVPLTKVNLRACTAPPYVSAQAASSSASLTSEASTTTSSVRSTTPSVRTQDVPAIVIERCLASSGGVSFDVPVVKMTGLDFDESNSTIPVQMSFDLPLKDATEPVGQMSFDLSFNNTQQQETQNVDVPAHPFGFDMSADIGLRPSEDNHFISFDTTV